MTAEETETLDVPAIAKRLGMGQSAVRKAIARGRLRATVVRHRKREEWKYVASVHEVDRYARESRKPRKEVRPSEAGE